MTQLHLPYYDEDLPFLTDAELATHEAQERAARQAAWDALSPEEQEARELADRDAQWAWEQALERQAERAWELGASRGFDEEAQRDLELHIGYTDLF